MLRAASRIQSLASCPTSLRVTWCDGISSQFSSLWLRNSIRDSRFFEPTSLVYRPNHLDFITQEAPIQAVEKCEVNDHLKVHWSDHSSEFNIPWLRAQDVPALPKFSNRVEPIHWDANSDIPVYEYGQKEDKREEWMRDLKRWGLIYVQGAPKSEQGLLDFVHLIGPIKQRYHPTSVFTIKNGDTIYMETDTVTYGLAHLAAHTDTSVYRSPVKLTTFLGVEYSAPEQDTSTFFVDAFRVAEELRHKDPESFELLTRTHTRKGRRRLTVEEPCDPSELPRYEWDTEDISPTLTVEDGNVIRVQATLSKHAGYPLENYSDEEMRKYFQAFKKFYDSVHHPKNQQQIVVKPGTLVLVDNHRLLHGRSEVHPTTKRNVIGCFISEEIFRSRWRLLLGKSSGLEGRWLYGCPDKSLEFLAERSFEDQ